ncbi:DNA primase [bacterium]|nr:DNA primase [bacterium]
MIPKEIIADITERAHVEDIVGEFVNLKKRGVNFIGLCPFHQEKTPSFTVSPNKGIYKCFGCGKSGDSVKFLMEHEHYNYPEALRYLAKKYGIEIPEEELTPEQKDSYSRKESIYIVLAYAEKFYQEQLTQSDQGELIGMPYVQERGINAESLENFKIGYAPGGWETFSKAALRAGYTEEYLLAAGLSIKTEKGNLIDRFRERIMFPIHSLSGRTIGFGGRILKTDKKEAKYINSPDTEVYNKSEVLYGLFQGKREVKSQDLCYIVEGYTDVISLHQKGISNVAASSGTSLTEGHLQLVKRYTNNICFLFDGDAAGIKASLRAIDLALEEGLNVKALALPPGEDPDSFAKTHSKPEIEAFLEDEAKDFIIFKTDLLLPEVKDDPIKKAEAIVQIVHSIALIPNALTRTLYVQQCAKLLAIEENVLVIELNKQLGNVLKNKEQKWRNEQAEAGRAAPPQSNEGPDIAWPEDEIPKEQQTVADPLAYQEEQLVKFILRFGHLMYDDEQMETVAEHILEFIETHEAHPDNKLLVILLKEYEHHLNHWGVAELNEFLHHPNEEIRSVAIDFLHEKYIASENWIKKIGLEIKPEDNYKDTMKRVLNRYKLSLIQKLIAQARLEIQEPTDTNDLMLALKTYKSLLEVRKEIADILGMVIIRNN